MNALLTIKKYHNVLVHQKKKASAIDAQWLQRHGEIIFHRCYRMLGDKDQAYDAMQEVLTRLLEVQAKRELAQPLHYLFRMSTNHCLDLLGQAGRTLPMSWDEPQTRQSRMPSESALLVRELVEQFGVDDISLLACRYVDGMTFQELGELHNRSDRAIKKRLDKIEAAIRQYLSRENDSPRRAR